MVYISKSITLPASKWPLKFWKITFSTVKMGGKERREGACSLYQSTRLDMLYNCCLEIFFFKMVNFTKTGFDHQKLVVAKNLTLQLFFLNFLGDTSPQSWTRRTHHAETKVHSQNLQIIQTLTYEWEYFVPRWPVLYTLSFLTVNMGHLIQVRSH